MIPVPAGVRVWLATGHQPLNRQAQRYRREGVDLSLSTLADQVGGCAVVLRPLYDLIRAHVFASDRVHGDDTPVPVLVRGKTATGRAWVYVRDDRPFGGCDPPAAVFFYSRDRFGDHPERHFNGYGGILQADAYAGFNRLYEAGRRPSPLIEAACWAHARRKFFVLADVTAKARRKLPVLAPLALEAVKRIDAVFAIERAINGLGTEERLAVRRARVAPLVAELGCGPNAPGVHGRRAEIRTADGGGLGSRAASRREQGAPARHPQTREDHHWLHLRLRRLLGASAHREPRPRR